MAAKRKFCQQGVLNEVGASVPESTASMSATKRPMSEETQMAAVAALARLSKAQVPSKKSKIGSSLYAKAKQEVLAEQETKDKASAKAARHAPATEVYIEAHPAVATVMFRCSMIGPDLLPRDQMEARIEEFLLSQLAGEPAMASALMIQTLNKNSEQVKQCVEILGRYIDNVIDHPGEEKYQRIRLSNKVLSEQILSLRGTKEFLQAVGFVKIKIEGPGGTSDEFLALSGERANDTERLNFMKEILAVAEPIRPELDRDIRVFHPSSKASQIEVPEEFYTISTDELRKEMQNRQEAVEKFTMLRTKEMRQKDRMRELRRYRYCLIRIRFPNDILLQGTFRANEKLFTVRAFVAECLEHNWIPFSLSHQLGSKLVEENSTLAELGLAPASLLQFAYDSEIFAEVSAQNRSIAATTTYLKQEILNKISSL